MDDTTIKQIVNKLMKSAQVVLTLAYLFSIGIGMLFNYHKYEHFGINVFDYATIFDYLIAPLADFRIIGFTFFTLIVTYLIFKGDAYWEANYPRSYLKATFNIERFSLYRRFKNLLFLLILAFYLLLVAHYYGSISYTETVDQETVTIEYINGERLSGALIGKTSDMIFIHKKGTAYAIPIAGNLKAIEIK